jgi:hypothetical protein
VGAVRIGDDRGVKAVMDVTSETPIGFFDALIERTRFARRECVEALGARGLDLPMPRATEAIRHLRKRSPFLAAQIATCCQMVRTSGFADARSRPDPGLDAIMLDCSIRFGSRQPETGYTALLFAVGTCQLDRQRGWETFPRIAAQLRFIVETAAAEPDAAAMIEANAFFVYTLITAVLAAPPALRHTMP